MTLSQVTNYTDVPQMDEDALMVAVAQQPVSVAVEADKRAFQLYKTGVMSSPFCGTKLDHGVLIVGYGVGGLLSEKYWKGWRLSFFCLGSLRSEMNGGAVNMTTLHRSSLGRAYLADCLHVSFGPFAIYVS